MSEHIVVLVDRVGFGPYHYDPSTGRDWTPESAAAWVRRCTNPSSRSGGGAGARVSSCSCEDWSTPEKG